MRTVDISGFGGGYERTCHEMINIWLKATDGVSFDEVFPDGNKTKKWDDKFTDLIREMDVTGAMYGASMSHFAWIKKKGLDSWLSEGEMRKQMTDIEDFEGYYTSTSKENGGSNDE